MNIYDYDEYDECDAFCSCGRCQARREKEELESKIRELERNPQPEFDKYVRSYSPQMLIDIRRIRDLDTFDRTDSPYIKVLKETDKAMLIDFGEYTSWIPKSQGYLMTTKKVISIRTQFIQNGMKKEKKIKLGIAGRL